MHDQIAFYAFHSFLVEVKTCTGYVSNILNINLSTAKTLTSNNQRLRGAESKHPCSIAVLCVNARDYIRVIDGPNVRD